MTRDWDVDPDDIDIDGIYTGPSPDEVPEDVDDIDTDDVHVPDYIPTAADVNRIRSAVAAGSLERYASQLNSIELADAVRQALGVEATGPGDLVRAAGYKIATDVLAGTVPIESARDLKEQALALEAAGRCIRLFDGGTTGTDHHDPAARQQTFVEIRNFLALKSESAAGVQDAIEAMSRDAEAQ